MNKFSKITSFLFVLLFFFHVSLKASHIAGGEITYSCLGNNQYKIFLNLYVDCAGISLGTTETINFSSSCGGNATAQLQVTPATTNGFEISQLCPSQVPQSTCNGGVLPGMHLYSYEGIITLAPVCNTWTMSWSTCCRNLAVTNLTSASSSYYIEATLNSQNAICNSSPRFNAQPIPYVCTNQFVSYSYGVTESDGDSLYYQLIPAYVAAGTPANYNGAYSGTSPIPGITINSQTGLITFTSSNIGNFVVVILVTEYDRATQQVLGTIMRDIQFVVLNCTNIVPSPNAGTITNLTGNALQTGPYSIDMCAGNSFNFNAVYTDANAADILTYISNIATALPGATITQVGASTNPLTLNIGWTAPGGSQGQNPTFTVTVSDGACPLQGQQTFVYSLNILFATVASADVTICTSQTAALNVTGGNTFNWVALSGSPISAGNFSCNPCANPVASPSVTTTYEVTSNLSSACTNKDTVTVTVVPDFTFNISQSTATSCLLSPVQLNVTNILPVANGYTYQWSPSTYLNDDTIQNPIATFTVPGTYTYIVTVTNPFGCSKADTITVTALAAASPVITAYSDTSFCLGGTATLGLNFSNINPAYCGLSTSGNCNGTGTPITIGAGISSNTATTYPAPYGNFQKNARHQFLYTAAELIGAGISSGKIDRLDFNVSSIQGTTSYDSYTIKLGCTSVTSLSTWQTGLSQVYNPKTHTVTAGWNAHIFDTAYIWDGVSNLVVDICYDNRTAPSCFQQQLFSLHVHSLCFLFVLPIQYKCSMWHC
jgi:hypothetical protein